MLATYWRSWIIGLMILAGAFTWYGTGTQAPKTTPEPTPTLPALAINLYQTTVSGISSGAYMAGQFQLAHASVVTGAGIIAGGPYGCAQSVFSGMAPGAGAAILSSSRAVNGCMLNNLTLWGVPNPKRLSEKARKLAQQERIDPIEDLASDRVYLFSGTNDRTVKPPIVAAARQFYLDLQIKPDNIRYRNDIEAGHGFVTEEKGGSCDRSSSPYIIDCDYDQAGALLNFLYGSLKHPDGELTGAFINFDQFEFTRKDQSHGLSKTGVIYVPSDCSSQAGCRVHIAYHGCSQNQAAVGDAFIRQSGLARWADNNRIVILFPQVSTGPLNPTGCWDWWGYTGKDYLTKSAPQIMAVHSMLQRLAMDPQVAAKSGS